LFPDLLEPLAYSLRGLLDIGHALVEIVELRPYRNPEFSKLSSHQLFSFICSFFNLL